MPTPGAEGARGRRASSGRAGSERGGDGPSAEAQAASAAAAERLRAQGAYDDLLSDEVSGPIREHWQTMQQWRIDEGKNYARSRSSQISRMAAGGMRADSDQWNANLARIDAAHADELAGFDNSATQGILNKWIDSVRAAEPQAGDSQFSQSGQTAEEYDARTSDEFLVANFGRTDAYNTFTDASGEQATAAATERTRQQAGQNQQQQASPWWV